MSSNINLNFPKIEEILSNSGATSSVFGLLEELKDFSGTYQEWLDQKLNIAKELTDASMSSYTNRDLNSCAGVVYLGYVQKIENAIEESEKIDPLESLKNIRLGDWFDEDSSLWGLLEDSQKKITVRFKFGKWGDENGSRSFQIPDLKKEDSVYELYSLVKKQYESAYQIIMNSGLYCCWRIHNSGIDLLDKRYHTLEELQNLIEKSIEQH